MTPPVWVFFYGSYMNRSVLAEVGLVPEEMEVARLAGWDIAIHPRANLVRNETECVHGVLARATHADLAKLYSHAHDVLGETYLPEAVITQTRNGSWRAALCYVCHDMPPAEPEGAYVERIVDAACELGLPPEYVTRLERFRP